MKIFDLSMPVGVDTPVLPGGKLPEIWSLADIRDDGWNEKLLTISSHFSTHVDAPFHMIPDGKTLDDFPLRFLTGSAIAIDVRGRRVIESALNGVKPGDIVFFYTGFTDKPHGKEFPSSYPTLSEETARVLVDKHAKVVGLDSPSPDREPYPIHKTLLKKDILIVENLTNLGELAGKRFDCYILPLKIKDADGAPCRVIGVLE